jgi:hypothetical protein
MILLLRSRELSLKIREKLDFKGFELMNPPLGRKDTHSRYNQLYELLKDGDIRFGTTSGSGMRLL